MSLIVHAYDTIRGRFERLRKGRAVMVVADELEISRITLQKFLDGELVSPRTILTIEEWCAAEEHQHDE